MRSPNQVYKPSWYVEGGLAGSNAEIVSHRLEGLEISPMSMKRLERNDRGDSMDDIFQLSPSLSPVSPLGPDEEDIVGTHSVPLLPQRSHTQSSKPELASIQELDKSGVRSEAELKQPSLPPDKILRRQTDVTWQDVLFKNSVEHCKLYVA